MTHDREDSNKVQPFLPSTMNGNGQLLCIVILGACVSIINGATVPSLMASAAVSATSGNDTSIAPAETTVNPGTVTAGAGTTLNVQTTQPIKPGGSTQVTQPSNPAKETTQPPTKPVVSTGTTPNKPTTTIKQAAGRKFDGPSFGGGFGLAAGLVIIFGIGYCCYTRRKSSGGYSQY
ncbi:uncharacterized protein LOC143047523 [Mytilus galloprovincialis]|uniref:uncharacterized protein LOC143047523 n=1 Tax=Mytilus galloprovincialis TaxID=29158 RepID=UPI003F7C7B2D